MKSDDSKASGSTSASFTTTALNVFAVKLMTGHGSHCQLKKKKKKNHWNELSGHMSSNPDSSNGIS